MSHFAKIDKDNIVTEVIVAEQDFINSGLVGDSFLWIQTSYNGGFRKRYVGKGDTYDKTNDIFVARQPASSWTLDSNHDWQPPTPMPADATAGQYTWDEDTTSWIDDDPE